MKLNIVITKECKQDIKRAKKQGKNLELLFEIIDMLSEVKTLDRKYNDHKLSGEYKGKRECHIEPDFLLIYQIKEKELILCLINVGNHSYLFKK